MRKTNTQKLGDVINEYMDSLKLRGKMKKARIPAYWKEIMGNTISLKTSNIYIKNNTLYVSLNSSVLRNELMMMREKIITSLNEKMGEDIIENIVLK